jgi:hypothetical protein
MTAVRGEEGGDDIGIELRRDAAQKLRDRVGRIEAHATRTSSGHRVRGVADRNDPASEWNIETGQPCG